MIAMVFAPNEIALCEESPPPEWLRRDMVRVKVWACGICGSDIQLFTGNNPWQGAATYPRRLGHEVSGIVVESPSETGVQAGDAIVSVPVFSAGCGACSTCRQGASYRCNDPVRWERFKWAWGLAEEIWIPSHGVRSVSRNLPLEYWALADLFAVALNAMKMANVRRTHTVTILGAGAMGLALCQVTKVLADVRVRLVGHEYGLTLAKCYRWADEITEPGPFLLGWSASDPSDVIVEASGRRGQDAIHHIADGGTLCLVGSFSGTVNWTYAELARNIRIVVPSAYSISAFEQALELMESGVLQPGPLITHRVPLTQIQQALQIATTKPYGALRVVVQPNYRRCSSGV